LHHLLSGPAALYDNKVNNFDEIDEPIHNSHYLKNITKLNGGTCSTIDEHVSPLYTRTVK